MDYAHGELGIPYSYSTELRDEGIYGFLLPPEYIVETGEENWAMHKMVAKFIMEKYSSP